MSSRVPGAGIVPPAGGGASLPVTSALLKGDGAGGAAAATAGTDYPGLATNNVFAAGVALEIRTQGGGANDYVKIGPFGGINAQSNSVGGRWSLATINGYDGLWLGADAVVAWNSVANLNGGAKDTSLERSAAGWLSPAGGVYPSGSTPGGFELRQVASGGTPGTNAARIYAKDNGGTAEIFVLDEAGNETQISPHAANAPFAADLADPFPHVIHERNAYVGVERFINISRLAYLVQALLPHEKIVVERDLPQSEWLDWDAVQVEHQNRYNAERAAEIEAREKAIRHAALARRASLTLAHMRAAAKAAGESQAEIDKLELDPEVVAKLQPFAADLEAARAEIPNRVRPQADVRKPAPAWLQPRMRDDYDNTRKPKLNWKQRLLAWLMK